jgi:hypothetical protein
VTGHSRAGETRDSKKGNTKARIFPAMHSKLRLKKTRAAFAADDLPRMQP